MELNCKSLLFLGVGSKFTKELLEFTVNSTSSIERVITIRSFDNGQLVFNRKIELLELNFHEINKGVYPELNDIQCPIDDKIFSLINSEILNIFKIMDRLDPYKYFEFDQRVSLMFVHLKYWYNLFLSMNVDLVISMDMPHEVQDYIAYILAEKFKIKRCFLVQSQIPYFYQILEDITNNDIRMSYYLNGTFSGLSIDNPLVKKYYEAQIQNDYIPFYMEVFKLSITAKIRNFINKIHSAYNNFKSNKLIIPKHVIKYLFLRENYGESASRKIRFFYKKNAIKPNLNSKFIYVPLHYQPERTTAPQGGLFAFQELMIEMLSKAAPSNTIIYVKEHSKQEIRGRYLDYYEKLLKYDNVYLIDNSYSSLQLIQNSFSVATVTGTAGWEAVCLEKPVVLFGSIFFQYGPGVFKIQSFEDLEFAFIKIAQNDTGINKKNLYMFLNCVAKYSYHGFSDELYFPHAEITWEDNLLNIYKNISSHFNNISNDDL